MARRYVLCTSECKVIPELVIVHGRRLTDSFFSLVRPRVADKLTDLVGEYFERFGTKPCCFDDLRPYLDIFSHEELQDIRTLLAHTTQTQLEVRCAKPLSPACPALFGGVCGHRVLTSPVPFITGRSEHDQGDQRAQAATPVFAARDRRARAPERAPIRQAVL